MDNEKGLTWSAKMRSLIQEMIHYRNSLEPGAAMEEATIAEFEDRYKDILNLAKDEYEYESPTKYANVKIYVKSSSVSAQSRRSNHK